MCLFVQVEVKMRKCEGLQWPALEGHDTSDSQGKPQKLPQMANAAKGDGL